MMIIVEAWRRVDRCRWQSSKVFFFQRTFYGFCHVSLPDCIYRCCLWEFGGHPRKYVGKCKISASGCHVIPFRGILGFSEAARILRSETKNVQLWEFPWESPHHLPTNSAPVPRFFCCLHQSIGSSPETTASKNMLAFGKLEWSVFFLQKLENTCKQFRQTLDQELQCWRRNILFKSYQSSLSNKLLRFQEDVGTNLERLFLEMSKFS